MKDDLDKKNILTGSTTPIDSSKIQNLAVIRNSPLLFKSFSLLESKESSGVVSLLGLFDIY